MNLTKYVKQILIINIVLFLLTYIIPSVIVNLVLFPIGDVNFLPSQLITHMFLHGSVQHLVFNMLALIVFGPDIERKYGEKRFIWFYLITGLICGISHLLFMGGAVVGASGALFGLMALYALINPNQKLYLYFLIPIKSKFIIGGIILFELYYVIIGQVDGVSHIAHLTGALCGLVLFLVNKKRFDHSNSTNAH